MRRLVLFCLTAALVATACADSPSVTTAPSTTSGAGAGGLQSTVDELITATEQVRGLEFVVDPVVTIVTADELAERVRQQIEEDLLPEDIAVAQRFYEILGLLDGTVDLGQAYADLYAEQVGGFYDNDTGEMVIMGGSDLSPLSKSIVVHELVHALTDQHFDFAAKMDELWDADRFHEASAIQALAEGDATYYQLVYLQTLPTDQQVDAVEESLQVDTTVLDSLPDWFGEDLSFPYDYGFGFVESLIADGKTAAVDQAYELLPISTEQILHPEKYAIREPALEVTLPQVDLAGYQVFEEAVFGEWNTQLYLLDGVDRGEAILGASGWGGDRYRLYWTGSVDAPAVAFVVVYEMDTPRDAEELAGSLALSAHRLMRVGSARDPVNGVTTFTGGDDYAYVSVSGRRVVFVASDDPSVGPLLVSGVGG